MLYHFNLTADDDIIEDEEGVDLPDIEAAIFRAARIARELIADEAKAGRIPLSWSITVIESGGVIVAEMPFANVVTLH